MLINRTAAWNRSSRNGATDPPRVYKYISVAKYKSITDRHACKHFPKKNKKNATVRAKLLTANQSFAAYWKSYIKTYVISWHFRRTYPPPPSPCRYTHTSKNNRIAPAEHNVELPLTLSFSLDLQYFKHKTYLHINRKCFQKLTYTRIRERWWILKLKFHRTFELLYDSRYR